MTPLEITLMKRDDESNARLQGIVCAFESRHHIPVHLSLVDWETGWGSLVRVALYNSGPDISEVGSTWLSDFIGMNAVRALKPADEQTVGGPEAFFKPAWNSGVSPTLRKTGLWSIPFLVDTRFVVYRRDWLAQAGVDETTAFATPTNFLQALAQLAEAGVPGPLALPTAKSYVLLQQAASWVWGAGGRFFTDTAHRCAFLSLEALTGLRDHFALGRFVGPNRRPASLDATRQQFCSGQAALTFTGPWFFHNPDISAEVRANLGVAFPPGVPFIGGANLMLWKHTRQESAAIKLMAWLTQPDIQRECGVFGGLLPARLEAFDGPPYNTEAHYQTLRQGLPQARTHQSFALWGMAEEQMTGAMAHIWEDVLANPTAPVDEAILRTLKPLAQRLDLRLQP